MRPGTVVRRHALLPVTMRLAGQPDFTIAFVVDTGLTEYLTLPTAAVAAMGLPQVSESTVVLANGGQVKIALHKATILWGGVELDVPMLATGRRPLLGAALQDGHELRVRYAEGDLVSVEEL